MIDKALETLMNESIDGTASAEETARMDAAIAADDEARGLFEDLQRLEGALASMPLDEPPAELKAGILRRIEAIAASRPEAPAAASATAYSRGNAFSWHHFFARFRPAYGLTFAGGIAAGIAVFALLSPPSAVENAPLSGVMAPQEAFSALPVADRASFDAGGVHGTLETRVSSGHVIGRIAIDSQGEAEVVAGFDATLHPVGFRRLEPATGQVLIGASEVHLHQDGPNTFWLIFETGSNPPSNLEFKVYSGELLYQRALRTTVENP